MQGVNPMVAVNFTAAAGIAWLALSPLCNLLARKSEEITARFAKRIDLI
jgi:hypothetical protein